MIDLAQIPDNGHRILSPSGWTGWSNCTGQMLGLGEARAKSTDGMASVEGTTGHYLLEISTILMKSPLTIGWHNSGPQLQKVMDDAKTWFDGIWNNRHNEDEVKSFALSCYRQIVELNFTQEMCVEIDKCFQRIKAYVDDGWEIWSEARVSLENLFGHKHCDGTCDILLFKLGRLLVVDLKYGAGIEVSPVENGQLSLYAGGALSLIAPKTLNINTLDVEQPRTVESVELIIMQPRINNGVWKSWECPSGYLTNFLKEAKQKANNALVALGGGPVEFNPSLSTCQWCHRKTNCKARQDKAVSDTHDAFAATDVRESSINYELISIDNQALSEILERAPFVLSFFNDMMTEALKRANAGEIIPERKLVKGRSSRKWMDEDELVAQLSAHNLKLSDIFNIKVKSPAQMEKLPFTEEQREVCKRSTQHSFGQPTLALESDPRPAVIKNSTQAFAAFAEAESK